MACGFAGIKDVRKKTHEDRMDSFFLAEMFKYLYLIFAENDDLTIDPEKYVFTTEAHLLPLSLSTFSNHTERSGFIIIILSPILLSPTFLSPTFLLTVIGLFINLTKESNPKIQK